MYPKVKTLLGTFFFYGNKNEEPLLIKTLFVNEVLKTIIREEICPPYYFSKCYY